MKLSIDSTAKAILSSKPSSSNSDLPTANRSTSPAKGREIVSDLTWPRWSKSAKASSESTSSFKVGLSATISAASYSVSPSWNHD